MFVKHALDDAQVPKRLQRPARRPKRAGLGLDDLKIVSESAGEGEMDSGDSDDEDEGSVNTAPDEITATALNLLLALLEGEPPRPQLWLLYSYWGL